MQEIELNGESRNITQDNIDKLKQIFPEVFNENKIDFDKLQAVLGENIDTEDEKYRFTWNGKMNALRLSQTPSTGTLRPCKADSVEWDTTQNLYIEGDNLEVLKLLQNSYLNKIKMIYIDPPYNTGNDFVYKDDFKDNIENYKKITGQVDSDGNATSTNKDTDGRYHTNWLNMMYPRLRLARNLLTDDGVIFISIDDKEYNNLQKICDEIFGAENRMETFHIQVRYDNKSLNEKDDFQKLIEYTLIYAKNKHYFIPKKPGTDYDLSKFCWKITELKKGEEVVLGGKKVEIFKPEMYKVEKVEEFGTNYLKATWASGSVLKGNTSGKFFDKQLAQRKGIDGLNVLYKVYGIGEDGLGYRYFTGPKKAEATQGLFYSGVPLERLDQIKKGAAIKYSPIINYYDYSGDFGNIRHEGDVSFNSGKKPVKMLKNIINIANLEKTDIILDFFSGSSSTAHACIQYNKENNTNYNFIMVQLPENNGLSDYKNVCELAKQRLRNVGNKIQQNSNDKILDIGFKVFKLDSSNIKKWNPDTKDLEKSLFDQVNNFVDGRTEEDVLYEIILKCGLDLTVPVEELNIQGKKVYSVGMGALIVCLDNDITLEVANEIAKLDTVFEDKQNVTVVFKDNGFKDDSVKTNIKETIRGYGIGKFVTV